MIVSGFVHYYAHLTMGQMQNEVQTDMNIKHNSHYDSAQLL